MSQDGTRTGFGFGVGADRTRAASEKKIQIRLKSGKIYGPYQRAEVISFIYAKKLSGDEYILIDDDTEWRPIFSDLEFYDIFQEVLFGAKQLPQKADKPKTQTKPVEDALVVKSIPEKTRKPAPVQPPSAAKPEKTIPPRSHEKTQYASGPARTVDLGRGTKGEKSSEAETPFISPPQNDSGLQNYENVAPAREKPLQDKTKPLVTLVIIGIIAALAYVAMQKGGGSSGGSSENFGSFSAQTWYARPLSLAMDGVNLSVGALPDKLEPTDKIDFVEGFNALFWISDLKELDSADPKLKLQTNWWARWAWDAYWLGLTLNAFDSKLGASLVAKSQGIVSRLEKSKLLTESTLQMFRGADLVGAENWEEASKLFSQAASQYQLGAWLNEETRWQAFWAAGAKGATPKRMSTEYDSGPLEMSSQVRSAFIERDEARYNDWVSQLATEDPISSTLWFTTAQVNWRYNKDGAQTANKLFTIGLGSLSLQPQPFQLVYWSQFAQFLQVFGRQATGTKVLSNHEIISRGNLERDSALLKKWWDLNQDEFKMAGLADEVFRRGEKGGVNVRDLATLYVLGYVVPGGAKYLAVAANHYALDKQWKRAQLIFDQITRVDKNSPDGWGGLVWVNASLFRFDKAFHSLDELNKITMNRPENTKYEALLYSLGREYDHAAELFDNYSRQAPNDALGHYFAAQNYLANEKNVDCVKSANLALAHAVGELSLKSRLLLLHCRILARMQAKEAVSELERLVADDPTNATILIELVDAKLNSDLDQPAVELIENGIRRFPRSFELRMKRGDVYQRSRDYDKAVAFYGRAAKDRPESIEPAIKIAEVYLSQKKPLDAAELLEAASRRQPEYPEIYLMAARAYDKAGKTREAAIMYEHEIEARPSYVGAFVEAAEFYMKSFDPGAVIRIFSKFDSEFQDHPRIRTRMAQAYLALKQMDKAAEEAQRAISLDNKMGEAYRVLGIYYDDQGQYEIAKKNFENYLMLLPGAADANTIRTRINQPPYR